LEDAATMENTILSVERVSSDYCNFRFRFRGPADMESRGLGLCSLDEAWTLMLHFTVA
jgi:hypothetical protein